MPNIMSGYNIQPYIALNHTLDYLFGMMETTDTVESGLGISMCITASTKKERSEIYQLWACLEVN